MHHLLNLLDSRHLNLQCSQHINRVVSPRGLRQDSLQTNLQDNLRCNHHSNLRYLLADSRHSTPLASQLYNQCERLPDSLLGFRLVNHPTNRLVNLRAVLHNDPLANLLDSLLVNHRLIHLCYLLPSL